MRPTNGRPCASACNLTKLETRQERTKGSASAPRDAPCSPPPCKGDDGDEQRSLLATDADANVCHVKETQRSHPRLPSSALSHAVRERSSGWMKEGLWSGCVCYGSSKTSVPASFVP